LIDTANQKTPKWLQRIKRTAELTEELVASLLMIIVAGLLIFQVASRYVFDTPFPWTEELSRYGFVWLIYIGAAFLAARNSHITVTFISDLFPERASRMIVRLSSLAVCIASAVVVISGFGFTVDSFAYQSPGSGLPMGWVYLGPLIGLTLISLHSIEYIVTGETNDEINPELEATV